MNSGCYGEDVSKILVSVQAMDYSGNIKVIHCSDIKFHYKSWKLIQDSGCAGMKIGDAQISDKHCNFFINNGNAKSKDLEQLIIQVKDKVFKSTGINLELEVQIIGKA